MSIHALGIIHSAQHPLDEKSMEQLRTPCISRYLGTEGIVQGFYQKRVAFFKAIRGCTCMCNQLYWNSDSGGANLQKTT